MSNIKFVNLHAHDGHSIGDGLGYPDKHFDFAFSNGLDAHAITNHGHMNSVPHILMHTDKMKTEGKDFKAIYGVEAYFTPSIAEWRVEYDKKKSKKRSKKDQEITATLIEDESEARRVKNILNRRRHLVLLAQNQTGLNNLFKLVSLSYRPENFYRYPRIDLDMLKKYNEGIIATSACLGGVYAGCYWEHREEGEQAVMGALSDITEKMLNIFDDRWYAELQWNAVPEQHELNHYTIAIARKYDIPLVSTVDSHYPNPEAWKDRELYKRLAWLGKSMPEWLSGDLPTSVDDIGYELYPKNGDQVWESYKKYTAIPELAEQVDYDDQIILESIERTYHIAHERIEDFRPDTTVRLPSFVLKEGENEDYTLAKTAIEGLRSKGLHQDEKYVERLHRELNVISGRGFSKYFLTMKAISDRAQEISLVGPARGSAAGALTSYVLGITQVDPIRWGLLFERFLTADGDGYPDIDYDVANPMRLKETLIREWGSNVVVPISNFNTLKLRSLIKDISKFYDIPFKEVNPVTSKMFDEATPAAKAVHGIKAGVYTPTFEEVMKFSSTLQEFLNKYPNVKTHIEALHGQVRSVSRHAGGVVIGEDLDKHMPLINSGGVTQTPWSEGMNVRHLEPMGFIKFDLLGLATIEMIEQCIGNILKREGKDTSFENIKNFYDKKLHPDLIDLEDRNVWKNIFQDGKFAGTFQLTQEGAQKFCVKAKPSKIDHLMAITSIYRPGPLSAKVDKQYISAKENPSEVEYKNDILKKYTEDTYGFLIYQEQIAILAHKLGKNVSLDEGNKLRKLLTKKGNPEVVKKKNKIFDKFLAGCLDKGFTKEDAEGLWQTFEYFSGYGFNKSHAASYCLISYQCAFLLNYYPAEWLAAFLDREPESRKEQAITIAKGLGYKIERIDINTSGSTWEVSEDGETLIQPLTSIKGLGEKAIEQILNNRPFSTVEELLFNSDIVYSKLNKKALDVLARCGGLNSLVDERFTGLRHFWSSVVVDRPKSKKRLLQNIETYQSEGDFSEEEKLEYLVSLTGLFPFDQVMTPAILRKIRDGYINPISEFDPVLGDAWFIPRAITRKKTKTGKDYWILEVIDSNSQTTKIRCWSVKDRDVIYLNRPYHAKLSYSDSWGFSTRSVYQNFKLLA